MNPIAGMRDALIHHYFGVDLEGGNDQNRGREVLLE